MIEKSQIKGLEKLLNSDVIKNIYPIVSGIEVHNSENSIVNLEDTLHLNIYLNIYLNEPKEEDDLWDKFNFDEHWKSGSHWVGMYVNLIKNEIYYFDSYGKRPEKRIRKFINRICKWCYKKNIMNLENFVMVYSPNDEIIKPPESGIFATYDKKLHTINLRSTDLYKKDWLGLKYLDDNNKLHFERTNCTHVEHRMPICFGQLYVIFKQFL